MEGAVALFGLIAWTGVLGNGTQPLDSCLQGSPVRAFNAESEQIPFRTRSPWILYSYGGRSAVVLGSKELRRGGGLAIQYERPDPKMKSEDGHPGSLVLELYYEGTHGGRIGTPISVRLDAVGITASALYRWNTKLAGIQYYIDLGWGIQAGNRTTRDLGSRINSTPLFGVGLSIGSPENELLVGLRFKHISNGGSVEDNNGQNQVVITLGRRI